MTDNGRSQEIHSFIRSIKQQRTSKKLNQFKISLRKGFEICSAKDNNAIANSLSNYWRDCGSSHQFVLTLQ